MNHLPDFALGLWSLLLLLGSLHGWFLCLVLIFSFRRSQVVLGSMIFILSYNLFTSFLWQSGLIAYTPHLIATAMPTLFLIGPFYYWFFLSTLTPTQRISWTHFVPAFVCVVTIIPFYAESLAFKIDYIYSKDPSVVNLPPTRAIYFGIFYLQLAFYWTLSLRLLNHPSTVPDGRKNKRFKRLSGWLKGFHYAFGIFMLVYLGTFLTLTFTPLKSGGIRYAAQFSLALLVHAIGYFTLKESTLIRDYNPTKPEQEESDNRLEVKRKILDLMNREKPFLNRDLTLSEFSRILRVSPAIVSTVVNQEFHSNFSEFVNKYRVKEAIKLLKDKRYNHFKVEAIGQEVGFKNKVNFNRVVKRYSGKTPSDFRSL